MDETKQMKQKEHQSPILCEIDIDDFCKKVGLERIYCEKESIPLRDTGINRPGLQLHGYYEYFDDGRIQMVGKVEMSYLMSLSPELREKRIERFFSYNIPCFIVCWDHPDAEIFVKAAEKYGRVLLKSTEKTTTLIYKLVDYIDFICRPKKDMHGVLVEVHGVGVLITGASGIGKSETALELLNRGNCFIADDVVEVSCRHGKRLLGKAPEHLQYYMEVRGIGIIDVRMLYGAKAVKNQVQIDMIIHLEEWSSKADYDRLGVGESVETVLGVDVPLVTMPVSGGRNIAALIETAAVNNRMKVAGINSAEIFCSKMIAYNEKMAAELEEKRKNRCQ